MAATATLDIRVTDAQELKALLDAVAGVIKHVEAIGHIVFDDADYIALRDAALAVANLSNGRTHG